MAFKDLYADRALPLPYAGKVYRAEPLDAELGPQVQAMFDVGIGAAIAARAGREVPEPSADTVELLDDLAERDLYRDVLGDTFDEMTADNVPWPIIKKAALTVMTDAAVGRAEAERAWNGVAEDGDGEGPKAPNRAAKRAAARKVPARSARRASTAGTRRPAPAKKAPASRGGRSSSGGSSSS